MCLVLKVSPRDHPGNAGSDNFGRLTDGRFILIQRNPLMGKNNFGPGGFSDQYDNGRMRSMDPDQHPEGTGAPFEDEYDFSTTDFFPQHGERYL
jgi:hypothetical protein